MKLDVAFFKPFVDGTLHTLKVSCSTEEDDRLIVRV
jgi:hypothetical protein